ncbi:MAG: hypothetical protein J2O39_02205, partial [Acidimicrobiales bacterium]|nr:hypothetical protein [Acidimicrobiales bacterium]
MTATTRPLAIVVLGAIALLVGSAVSSLAPPDAAAAQGARMELVAQTPILEPGQTSFALTLRVNPGGASLARLTATLTVYDALTSRSEFDQTLGGHGLSDPLVSLSPGHVDQLPRDQAGDLELTVPVRTGGGQASSGSLDLADSQGGVYPVVVTLESPTGATLQRLVTYLVYAVPSAQSHPLGVAVVLPVRAPIGLSRAGQPFLSSRWSAALSALAHTLAANPRVPLTLAPSPETIEALADSGRPADHVTLSLLAAWAQGPGHQVLASPYVPISLSALTRAGLNQEISSQLARGEAVLAALLKVSPSVKDWLAQPGPLDRDTLLSLDLLGVKDVVTKASELSPVATTLTPAQPFELEGPNQYRPLSVVADTGLASHFAGGHPSIGAHHALADLAQIYFEQPNSALARAVVVTPPDGWLPNASLLEPLLGALGSNPTARPMTLSQVFDNVAPETVDGVVRQRQPAVDQPVPPSLPATALEQARQHTQALISAAGGDPSQLSGLDNLVLAAESSSASSSARQRYLSSLEADVNGQLSELSLPGGQTVTLTAAAGRIPITIESHARYPVR